MPTRREFFGISAAAAGVFAVPAAQARVQRAPRPLDMLFLGGTGFIGPHQIEYALARGHRVTMFNRGRNSGLYGDRVEELTGNRDSRKDDGLKSLSGRRRWLMLRLVGNGLAQAGLAVALALLIRDTFDRFATGGALQQSASLPVTAGALLLLAVAAAGLRWRERIDAEQLGQSYVQQLRLLLFDHLSQATQRTLLRRSRGGALLRFIGDLGALRQWVSLGLLR